MSMYPKEVGYFRWDSPASAPGSAGTDSSTSRTHSESVSPFARARSSSMANSASLTFVLTLLMRSGGFSGHRLNWILEEGHAMAARRRIDSEGAGDRLRGSSS